MTAFPQLKTSRLLLRQIVKTDLQNIFDGLSHPEVVKYYGVRFDSLDETQEQLKWRRAEIGFWLLPQFQKKGIISEAAEQIIKYAFNQLKLHRIEAHVETENSNSIKALERLNFHHEGTLRDYEVKNGNFISVAIYARIGE